MGELFPLALFPEGALASSVITTVLVGVWVTVFFNLRFGWVLSGLVVPGYLVPLILLEPVSAAVIVVEAVITFGIVRLLAVQLADTIGWTTFFGRDRFFALVLTSVAVRLVMDGLVLPPVAELLNERLDLGFDWTRDLESFGLIVIALYANQFWKTGLARGFLTSGVTILLTLVIVRFGLMELTNFRISDIGYLYELLAASLVASSKAYIILIVTAFIASRLNLRAGLDFNGLLIPALVALQWYEPTKIVTSFAEALIILAGASAVLKLPIFANATIEGGRKILLFFNVSFAWKMVVGYAVFWAGIEVQTADLYGFGYLLSTLVALKLHDLAGGARMLTALTAVSGTGALVGTLAGFGLAEGSRVLAPVLPDPNAPVPARERDAVDTDLLAMSVQRNAYALRAGAEAPAPDAESLELFRDGLAELTEGLAPDASNLAELTDARRKIALAGFGVRVTPENRVVIENVVSQVGRTLYLIDPAAPADLTVSLPDAQAARGLTSAAAALFELSGARALIVRGSAEAGAPSGTESYFHVAHEALDGAVVQLTSTEAARSVLEVSGLFPRGFDLAALEEHVGEIALETGRDIRPSPQRATADAGFALLDLRPDALYALTSAMGDGQLFVDGGPAGVAGVLRAVVAENVEAPRAEPPSTADLLYAEVEVMAPLIDEVLPRLRAGAALDAAMARRIRSIDVAARSIGYRVRVLRDEDGAPTHLLLASGTVSWGSYAFRIGRAKPVFLHVPTGLRDRRTLEFGLSLLQRLGASSILVAGRADRDGLPAPELNVLNPDHPPGLYDLAAKLLIQSREGESVSVVLRNIDAETLGSPAEAEIVLSPESVFGSTLPGPVSAGVVADLASFGFDFVLHQGSERYAGLEPGVLPQAGFLSARPRAGLLSLWLAPELREHYADRLGPSAEEALFRALDVPTLRGTLSREARGCVAPGPLPAEVRAALRRYVATDSPLALQAMLDAAAGAHDGALDVRRVADLATRQTFVTFRGRAEGCLRAVANLAPLAPGSTRRRPADRIDGAALDDFAASRAALLVIGEASR